MNNPLAYIGASRVAYIRKKLRYSKQNACFEVVYRILSSVDELRKAKTLRVNLCYTIESTLNPHEPNLRIFVILRLEAGK